MEDSQKITFTEEGDQEPGLEPGDIIIVLDEKQHEVRYIKSGVFFEIPNLLNFFINQGFQTLLGFVKKNNVSLRVFKCCYLHHGH